MPILNGAHKLAPVDAVCSSGGIRGKRSGPRSIPPPRCSMAVPVRVIAILRVPMRIAVDAHAIGRHLTGNEVYVRSLLREFAALDLESQFVTYISEPGAETLVPRPFKTRHVAADPYYRLGWDLSRCLGEDKPDLV